MTPRPFPSGQISPHALGAVAVVVGLAWTFRTTLAGGITLHWLAAPFALFVLGPRWSVAAVAAGALFAAATGAFAWAEVPVRLLLDGLVPIGIAWAWLRAVERWLPPHLFVYLFVAVFAGTLLSVFGAGALQRLVLPAVVGPGQAADRWIALLILADGEAVTTGFLVTGLALYRPEWLQTFDPDRYLRRPDRAR
jgi:uncharacterized membrane protein